jgi:nitrous oxidase accessory protein NosD
MINFQCGCWIRRFFWGLMLLGSLMSAQWSFGASYYVALDGNDANPGTEEQPFQTISNGARILQPGDTLYIREGTYPESYIDTIRGGTSWDVPVTVAAYPGEHVTIQGSLGFQGPTTAYIIIDSLILDGANLPRGQWWPVVAVDYSQTPADTAHHIRLQNSEIRNGPSSGVNTNCGAEYNEFINLKVHDNGTTDFDHGLYISSAHNLIEGSDVYRNAGWGIHVYNEGSCNGQVNNNTVRSNQIHDNAAAGNRGPGILLSSGRGNVADSNTIWGNHGGIQIDYGSIAAQVAKNVIYGNSECGICVGSGSTDAVVLDNSIYDNNGPAIVDYGANTSIVP